MSPAAKSPKPSKSASSSAKSAKSAKSTGGPPPPPGAPALAPVSLEEPTAPHDPLPPKPEQDSPETVSPTGAETGADPMTAGQQEAFLTTSLGARLRDTDHSLRAGNRGPTLLQDHHLREKITHFDHERIPERVVHA